MTAATFQSLCIDAVDAPRLARFWAEVLGLRVERDSDRGRVAPAGPFDLAHATAVERAVENAEPRLEGCG